MKIRGTDKVVCCCSWGQVRSVATRKILFEKYGMDNVLACGIDRNGTETLDMLFAWADVIVVAGEQRLADKVPSQWFHKLIHFDIGEDRWGNAFSESLANRLMPMVKQVIDLSTFRQPA